MHLAFTKIAAPRMTMAIVITMGFFERDIYGKMIGGPNSHSATDKDAPTQPEITEELAPHVEATDADNVMISVICEAFNGKQLPLEVGMNEPVSQLKQRILNGNLFDSELYFPEQLKLVVGDMVLEDCNRPRIKDYDLGSGPIRVSVFAVRFKLAELVRGCPPTEQRFWATPSMRYSGDYETQYMKEFARYIQLLTEFKKRRRDATDNSLGEVSEWGRRITVWERFLRDQEGATTDAERRRNSIRLDLARPSKGELKEKLSESAQRLHRWLYTDNENAWRYDEMRAWKDDDTSASYLSACDDYVGSLKQNSEVCQLAAGSLSRSADGVPGPSGNEKSRAAPSGPCMQNYASRWVNESISALGTCLMRH